MNKHRGALAPLVASGLLAVALVAGCGSGTSSDKSGGSGASGSPIKVMTIVPLSGNGVAYPEEAAAAQASAKYVNANGGVAGHPIDLTVCDDQNNPNGAAACGRKAVEEHAVAVVGSFSVYANEFMTALTAANIPYLAPCCSFASQELAAPNSFNTTSGQLIYVGVGIAAGQANGQNGSIVNVQTAGPRTEFLNQLIQAGLKSTGFTGTYKNVVIPAQATDYAPTVAQITNGSSTIILSIGQLQAKALLPALASAGAKQHLIGVAGNSMATSVVKANPDITNGATIVDYYPPLGSSDKWKPFKDAFAKYASSDQKSLDISNLGSEAEWIGMNILKQVGQGVTGDFTASNLLAALKKTTSVDTGGVTPPLDFTKPFPDPALAAVYNTSVTFEKVSNGDITWPDNKFYDAGPPFNQYMK